MRPPPKQTATKIAREIFGRHVGRVGLARRCAVPSPEARQHQPSTGVHFMMKHMSAAAVAIALIAAPLTPAFAQAAATTIEQKAPKKLTAQQQKMKDCGTKWQEHKKTHDVKGQAEYRKFLSGCLKS
jgi:hypothetical protein